MNKWYDPFVSLAGDDAIAIDDAHKSRPKKGGSTAANRQPTDLKPPLLDRSSVGKPGCKPESCKGDGGGNWRGKNGG